MVNCYGIDINIQLISEVKMMYVPKATWLHILLASYFSSTSFCVSRNSYYTY